MHGLDSLRGHTATTKRLGDTLEVVARKEVPTLSEARKIECSLKRKKNPKLAIYDLPRVAREENSE